MTTRFEVCPAEDLAPGERRIVEVDSLSIGVFNVDGEYYALNNVCPHQLAPLCEGRITGTVQSDRVGEYEWEKDGQIVQCPWHHWEFDITSGESVFNPHKVRTRTFDVEVVARSEVDEEQIGCYGTSLQGDEPPVETYDVEVEEDIIVLYI